MTIITDSGLMDLMDLGQLPPTSPAVITAREVAAQAERLASLPTAPEDRREILLLLVTASQHLFDAAVAISLQITAEAPPLSTLGEQPWARMLAAVDAASAGFVQSRDAFAKAVEADEDRAACQYGGDYTADLRSLGDRLTELETTMATLTLASPAPTLDNVRTRLLDLCTAIAARARGLNPDATLNAAIDQMLAARYEHGIQHRFAATIRAALEATLTAATNQQRGGAL
ncbi:hypothetical protein ABT340_41275 [Streptosporangium sp. NPDC000239]|uniref:hypothetical protein n=1 Tax=Streptosporangium sp. NPDC000239 TaxID=3154248 RepID=UPI00331EC90F